MLVSTGFDAVDTLRYRPVGTSGRSDVIPDPVGGV